MSAAAVKDEAAAHRFAKDHLKAFVERVERLEEEKKALSDDIRDVMAEAKANGFDTKAIRAIVRLRKQDVDERKESEAILETYMLALGMLDYSPEPRTGAGTGTATSARAQACEFASDVVIVSTRGASEDFPGSDATSSRVEVSALPAGADAGLTEKAAAATPAAAAFPASSLQHGCDEDQPRPDQPHPIGLCPGGTDQEHSSPPTGGERSRPVPIINQVPPGGTDDPGDMPPFLIRDADNVAPYMRKETPAQPSTGPP